MEIANILENPGDYMDWSKVNLQEQFLAAMQVSFTCAQCGKCCQKMNGIAYNSIDSHRMAKSLGIGVNEFIKEYTIPSMKKPGDRWLALRGEEKKCPFLGENGCTQYEGRGQVCRYYPWFAAENLNSVRENKPHRLYYQCAGMVNGLLEVIRLAMQMPFNEAQEWLKTDVGKLCWLHMLADEGKDRSAAKLVNEAGYANLPRRESMREVAKVFAVAYMTMAGERKLQNMLVEVEKYAASFGK